MANTLSEVELQLRDLPAEDRARLAEFLLESLGEGPTAEIEAEWQREIADRVAAYDRGDAATFDAKEVFAEARRLAK